MIPGVSCVTLSAVCVSFHMQSQDPLSGRHWLTHCISCEGACGAVRMSIRVLESAPALDDTLVHVTLSHDHRAAAATPAPPLQACPESQSEALDFFASLDATKAAEQGSSSAPATAGKPAAEIQNQTALKQLPSMGAVSQASEQLSIPALPELSGVTSTATTAESMSANKTSAPVSLVLGAALSQSWGLPLPWPLPSWRPATTPAATTAAVPATTTAAMTAAMPATPTTTLDATMPAATPTASAAANAWAATPAATPAATEAQADPYQKLESSLVDEAFQLHETPEAVASLNVPQDDSSPSTTAQASNPSMSSDSPHADESCRMCVSVPESESAQPFESAQQQHMPTSAPNSELPKHFPLSAAAPQSVTPPAGADSDNDRTVTSQNGLQRQHGHPHLGSGSLTQLEETAPEAALSAQDAAPDSAEHDLAEHDSTELAHFKPEQQALLAKGLQLCNQVQQV